MSNEKFESFEIRYELFDLKGETYLRWLQAPTIVIPALAAEMYWDLVEARGISTAEDGLESVCEDYSLNNKQKMFLLLLAFNVEDTVEEVLKLVKED